MMQKNTAFSLIIIMSIAILLRFSCADKPEGLWNDEYISYYISSTKDWGLFFKRIFENCHTPLYYFYLKLWMYFFSDTDFSLRISSIVPSIISVPVMYFTGKEFKDKNTGLLCAMISAISSFNIYFAQEVRFYSLLFLLAALTVLFFIRSIKNPTRVNLIFYFIFQGSICILHTPGIAFGFIMSSLSVIHLIQTKTCKIKKIIIPSLIFITAAIIAFPFIYSTLKPGSLSQFWSEFNFSKILFNITDYFSPIQLNIINTPKSFIKFLYNGENFNYLFVIFGIFPSLIAIYAIYNAIKQNNKIFDYLIITGGLYYILLITASIAGKVIPITKYSCEIYPILILGISFGLLSISKEKYKKIFIFLFLFLNIFYLMTSSDAAFRKPRREGNKIVADLLKESGLKKTDYVLLTFYDTEKFTKYLKSEDYRFYSINKYNFNYILFDNPDYSEVIKNGKNLYKNSFVNYPNEKLIKYINHFIIYPMNKGDRAGLVFLKSVSFYDEEKIKLIVENDKTYKKTPFIFLIFSSIKINTEYAFKEYFKLIDVKEQGDWMLVIYEKTV